MYIQSIYIAGSVIYPVVGSTAIALVVLVVLRLTISVVFFLCSISKTRTALSIASVKYSLLFTQSTAMSSKEGEHMVYMHWCTLGRYLNAHAWNVAHGYARAVPARELLCCYRATGCVINHAQCHLQRLQQTLFSWQQKWEDKHIKYCMTCLHHNIT